MQNPSFLLQIHHFESRPVKLRLVGSHARRARRGASASLLHRVVTRNTCALISTTSLSPVNPQVVFNINSSFFE